MAFYLCGCIIQLHDGEWNTKDAFHFLAFSVDSYPNAFSLGKEMKDFT
jgi:hypothetical protein